MAHFKTSDGNEIHLKSYPHLSTDIYEAAVKNGFGVEKNETVHGTLEFTQLYEKWEKYLNIPMLEIWVLRAIE